MLFSEYVSSAHRMSTCMRKLQLCPSCGRCVECCVQWHNWKSEGHLCPSKQEKASREQFIKGTGVMWRYNSKISLSLLSWKAWNKYIHTRQRKAWRQACLQAGTQTAALYSEVPCISRSCTSIQSIVYWGSRCYTIVCVQAIWPTAAMHKGKKPDPPLVFFKH